MTEERCDLSFLERPKKPCYCYAIVDQHNTLCCNCVEEMLRCLEEAYETLKANYAEDDTTTRFPHIRDCIRDAKIRL
jgi:hypothetical protein